MSKVMGLSTGLRQLHITIQRKKPMQESLNRFTVLRVENHMDFVMQPFHT